MIFDYQDYREYLKEVLVARVQKNPNYSLRAFAKNLGFSHSSLSEVLTGKINFAQASARKIGNNLGLTAKENEYFCLLIELKTCKDYETKEVILERLRSIHPEPARIHDLSVDHFKQISEWTHVVILETALLDHFEVTPENVSKKLGINRIEAEQAINRLLRLDLLEKNKNGKIFRPKEHLLTQSPSNYPALYRFYKQMLRKTSEAIDTQTSKERISGFEMLPFSEEMLPKAKAILEECFSRMVQLSKTKSKKDRVYYLSIHFFNVFRNKEVK